ncbi:MAG TPA: fibronectin type III-like domain-contianing protein, partial [Gemmatimonadaceae bacterium]|nr:fibronectin type III-like domain-contianing protein [Gemmatimonadaceae bacterium]
QVPIYYAHRATGRPTNEQNKYTSRYLDVLSTPLYPFGHGLSYTTFTTSAPRLSAPTITPNDTLGIEVDVANSGSRAGDAVVQVYVRDDVGSVTRPVRELRGFRRVALAAGERRTLRFQLDVRDLAFTDATMRYVAEPGRFTVFAGLSVADSSASARFELQTRDNRPWGVVRGCPVVR